MTHVKRAFFCWLILLVVPAAVAATSGEAMLLEVSNIFAHATVVGYRHFKASAAEQLQVSANGEWTSRNDCSGFVSFVLQRTTPQAYADVQAREGKAKHPRAITYAQFFQGLETNRVATGWVRVATWRELRPGDVIAWSSPPRTNSENHAHNAGHVMFVAQPPSGPHEETVDGKTYRYMSVLVLDSSSVRHFLPETFPPLANQTKRNGLGFGVVRLLLDERDQPIGYWEGTWWGEGQKAIRRPTRTTILGFGRVEANQ